MSELDISKVEETYEKLALYVKKTPVLIWDGPLKDRLLGDRTVYLKLEFTQHSGSFKPRGAFSVMLGNLEQVQNDGVIAVSRGNHACAVSYAAKMLGASAKVVVPHDASTRRIGKCKSFGAEVILASDVREAFAIGERIQREEGRLLVHPYEGELVALGTACVGKELIEQVPHLEEVYVACGGGGLLAGVSAYIKQKVPLCRIVGVEPQGADSMTRSLEQGHPVSIDKIETIADSLGTLGSLEFSFGLCQKYGDGMVVVSDREIVQSMQYLYEDLTFVLEPAGAAALSGVIKDLPKGKEIGVILCGANIELSEYETLFETYLG